MFFQDRKLKSSASVKKNFNSFRQFSFSFFLSVDIFWGFTKFLFKQMLKISAFYLEKQKFYLKKYDLSQKLTGFNIKTNSFVYWPNFQQRFCYRLSLTLSFTAVAYHLYICTYYICTDKWTRWQDNTGHEILTFLTAFSGSASSSSRWKGLLSDLACLCCWMYRVKMAWLLDDWKLNKFC